MGKAERLGFSSTGYFKGYRGIPFTGILFSVGPAGTRLWIEALVMLASLSPGRLWAHPSLGRPLGSGALGGPERKAFVTRVPSVGRES